LPTIDFDAGFGAATPGSTLAPLPERECAVLREVRDAGNAAHEDWANASAATPWPRARGAFDERLARYELTLLAASRASPRALRPDLRRVAREVSAGRRELARAGSAVQYQRRVADEVFDGFLRLNRAGGNVGSACGEGFTFWPSP
jgi:hypothetical protein